MGINVKFGCTACGRCCYGSTQVLLDEVENFSSKFPLGITFRVLPPKKSMDRTYFQHLRNLSFQVKSHATENVRVLPTISTVTPGRSTCPELGSDGLCGLHDLGKPLACAIAPLATSYPLAIKYDAPPPMLKSCPSEALKGKPLIRGGKVVDEAKRTALCLFKSKSRKQLPSLEMAFSLSMEELISEGLNANEAFDILCFEASHLPSGIMTSIGIKNLLQSAVFLGELSKMSVAKIAANQIDVCRRFAVIWAASQDAIQILEA